MKIYKIRHKPSGKWCSRTHPDYRMEIGDYKLTYQGKKWQHLGWAKEFILSCIPKKDKYKFEIVIFELMETGIISASEITEKLYETKNGKSE